MLYGSTAIIVFLFFLTLSEYITMVISISNKINLDDSDCPVCLRVIRAVRDLSQSQKLSTSKAFDNYCSLSKLEIEDLKFCYNTESIRNSLFRLFDFGADEFRICKRVKKENSDFCKVKIPKNSDQGVHFNNRLKRGIIYI